MSNKVIVVLGGSFNPPTLAHKRLLLAAVDALDAELGLFVPSSDSYVRNKMAKVGDPSFVLSETVREDMLSAMAADDPRLCVDTVEFGKKASGKGQKWRTVDTLNALSERYPDYEIYFLAGGDKVKIFPRWDRITEFLSKYRIIVVKRDGDEPEKEIARNAFLSERSERFFVMNAPDGLEGISSSAIREAISSGNTDLVRESCHPAVRLLLLEAVERKQREICGFFEEYRFLSNFYEAPVTYGGLTYQNNEAAFQAQKCQTEEEKRGFTALTPQKAKYQGRRVALRPDWEEVKVGVMEEIVRAKFTQNQLLAIRLINTGDSELIEGNTWRDTFWGVDMKTRSGQNHLGRILMKVRAELNASVYSE